MNRKERRQKARAAKNRGNKVNHHGVLAEQLFNQGKIEDAISAFQRAVKSDKSYVQGWFNLGVLYNQTGKGEEAVKSYKKAISIKPDYSEAYYSLGNALKEQNCIVEAISSYQKAIALKPDFLEAHINLGNIFKDQNCFDDAIICYRAALTINPNFAEAHNNLGNIFRDKNELSIAVESYQNALINKPDYCDAYYNLGNALHEQGKIDDAHEQFKKAISCNPAMVAWKIRKAILMPIIPRGKSDIFSRRESLLKNIETIKKQKLRLEDLTAVGATNFYLSYHNLNNKSIMEKITELYYQTCPQLADKAKLCKISESETNRPLRVGFLSAYLWEHTIGKLICGIIQNFSREIFEVSVFKFPGIRDKTSEAIESAADKIVPLFKNIELDRSIIENEQLDILFYPDIGMDPHTYYLSLYKLAPIQVVTWGHPDTTGNVNIDYFISSELIEKPGSENQYTEKLIKLSLLPTFYIRPQTPQRVFQRSDFGFDESGPLYVCPQTLFKFHPCFDEIIGNLLTKDKKGSLVLIDDGKGGHWNDLLRDRIGQVYPDVVKRIVFTPRMDNEKFLGLLILADALLDVPTFSGGNSSLEAFAMGAPIVTWPGEFMRTRVTAGCYKQMGLSDYVVKSAEEYILFAFALANDKNFKTALQKKIRANNHKLFERIEVIRELEEFFVSICLTQT